MPDEFFFLAFAGLGLSLAGFTGLIHAIDRRIDADSPITKWRVRTVVERGFVVTLAGLLVTPAFRLTDVPGAVRIVSVFFLIANGLNFRWSMKPGPAWPEMGRWYQVMALIVLVNLLLVVNLFLANVPLLQIGFILALAEPISILITTVLELHREEAAPGSQE